MIWTVAATVKPAGRAPIEDEVDGSLTGLVREAGLGPG
jgi:hypothetical protein